MSSVYFDLSDEKQEVQFGAHYVVLHRLKIKDDLSEELKKELFDRIGHGRELGWVERAENINNKAVVFDNAKVFGNAKVSGKAKVSGDAWVFGNACVSGNARVSGKAKVSGYAKVFGDAWVFDNEELYQVLMV